MSNVLNPVELTSALIKCRSITPTSAGSIDLIISYLEPMGFICTKIDFGQGDEKVENLYARLGSLEPNICFAGHVDVVPTGDEQSWSIDPFGGEIKKGKIWGRGAADMKSGIAAFIAAVSEFMETNKNLKDYGSISFIITSDEEGKAINGTKKVVEWLINKSEKISGCIVGEPTNPNKLGEMIKIGRRGSISGNIIVSGSQGHVAYPHLSNNPINTLVKICKKLNEHKLDKGNKNFQPSNLEITSINVDNAATNVIPAKARAQFNVRFNNLHTSSSLKKKINSIVKNLCKKNKCKFKIDFHVNGESFLTKPNKTIYMARNIIKKVTKIKPKFSTTGGTSDARFIKKIAPCLEFGLVNKTMHKVDECVSLKDLKNLTKIYQNILEDYFR